MAETQKAAAERLSQKEDVKKALQQTTPGEAEPKHVTKVRRLTLVGVYGALLVALVAVYVLIDLVDPKHAGGVKTELIQKILQRFNAAPDRVLFPKSNSR